VSDLRVTPEEEPAGILPEMQGAARVRVLELLTDLRDLMMAADIYDEPAVHTRIRLNDAAHRLSVAVNDFGRLLP